MYKGEFFFSCPVLSTKEPIQIKELNVSEYVSLLKFLKNNNLKDIEYYIEYLLKRLVLKDYHKLNVLDKFIILLTLRAIILGPEVSLLQSNSNIRLILSIDKLSQKILDINPLPTRNIQIENITMQLNYPKQFFTSDMDLFSMCLENIKIGNINLNMVDLTEEEKEAIFNKLPQSILNPMKIYMSELEDNCQQNILFRTTDMSIKLSVFDDTLIQLLKILLSDDLKSIYDISYVLISKANFSWSDIMLMNPAEMKIFYSRLVDESSKIAEEMKPKQSPIKTMVDSF